MKILILAVAGLCAVPAAPQTFVPSAVADRLESAAVRAKTAEDFCSPDLGGDHRVECHEWMLKNVRVVDDATLERMRYDPDRAPTWTAVDPDYLYSLQNWGRIGWRGGYFLDAAVEFVGMDYRPNGRQRPQCAAVVNQDRARMLAFEAWLVKDIRGTFWMPASFVQRSYFVSCPEPPPPAAP